MISTARPAADECAPGHAAYLARIADDEDILQVLADQLSDVVARLEAIPESQGQYRYAAGKWTIKELVGHLTDTERIFAYRGLRIARGDATPLPAFDENAYVPAMEAGARTLADLIAEWADARRATLSLFRHLPAAAWARRGIASGHPATARAQAYIIAGHVRHHLEVLAARYSA